MLLPLIRRIHNRIRIVEPADLDLTDYNAPLLGPAAPRDAQAARAMWRDLRGALRRLPGGADLIRLRKMPVETGGLPNPLALLDGAGPCALNGNVVSTGDDFKAWRFTLERTVRKELERSWRVFTRDPAAAFNIVTNKDDALRLLSTMAAQQGERMQHLGLNFVLNDETYAAFYRNLVRDNVANGYAVLSALTVGDEVVATLLGIRQGAHYVMVRISNAGEQWSNCSPGRLIIERTMAALHKRRRPPVRFQHRQLCLQAPLRGRADRTDGFQRGIELARTALRAPRPRRALAARASEAGRAHQARVAQDPRRAKRSNALPGRSRR